MTKHVNSYYAATANPSALRAQLRGQKRCDVCIIGAGFSGLSTALQLAERGYKVIILEAAKIAWGASGRNGGQMVNGFNKELEGIKLRYGQDAAKAIGTLLGEGADIIRGFVKKYNIECDLKCGSLFAALTKRQERLLQKRQRDWQAAGYEHLEMIDTNHIKEYVNTDLYCAALLDHHGGHLHPMNLALGEAAAIESLGGEIFEQSPVTGIKRGRQITALTTEGEVQAEFLVACGNAYLEGLIPEIANKILPASSQIVVTEPLGEQQASFYMPGDQCVEDANHFIDYYRMTADKRLLFGGGTIYSGKDPADIRTEIGPHIEKTFPALKNIKLDYAWGGNIGLTVSRIMHMGRIDNNLYFSHGYSGHGITPTHTAGRLLAEAITQQTQRIDIFASLNHIPFPGGKYFRVPITTLGAWYYRLREIIGV